MKAPSTGYRIVRQSGGRSGLWFIFDDGDPNDATVPALDPPVWKGKTFGGARTAHYRLAVARLTGKPVSYKQARRAGNA